jgi:prepilin-type N-terminal cleavage/methylation domain-containing protein
MYDVTRTPAETSRTSALTAGFTLIELSIVLVIIGLIVGGVLVGQNLIAAAGVRATITQIEKYNTAVNTFRDKYGALPGDLNASVAAQFGFTARGTGVAQGDGNGVIQGTSYESVSGVIEGQGETPMFWVDLTTANGLNVNLIDGSFSAASPVTLSGGIDITGAALNNWLPQAKLGSGNYVYVFSDNSTNYFGISGVSNIKNSHSGEMYTNPGMTVQQAYSIDQKIDDGMPMTGNVIAGYAISTGTSWAGIGVGIDMTYFGGDVFPGSSTSCMDDGGVGWTILQYSVEENGGGGVNCALSFRFQ